MQNSEKLRLSALHRRVKHSLRPLITVDKPSAFRRISLGSPALDTNDRSEPKAMDFEICPIGSSFKFFKRPDLNLNAI